MGVDFYTCKNEECGYNFADCGPFFSCTCEARFCSDECGAKRREEGEDVYGEPKVSCTLCRGESVTSHDMVLFLLSKAGLSYEQALDAYKAEFNK